MSVGHYENFPVASIFLPRALRRAVLGRIEAAGCDVFGERLVLRTRDWPGILWRALAA